MTFPHHLQYLRITLMPSFAQNANRLFFNISIELLLLATSVLSLIIISIPMANSWELVVIDGRELPPIATSIRSFEFIISLVASLSLSVPILIELIVRFISTSNVSAVKLTIVPNASLLFALMIPDLLMLFYASPYNNYEATYYLVNARYILLEAAVFSYLYSKGSIIWTKQKTLLITMPYFLARIFGVYIDYFDGRKRTIFMIIAILSEIFSSMVFLLLTICWFLHIQNKLKSNIKMTLNDSLCNNYVIALLLCSAGLAGNYFAHNAVRWSQWDTTNLTIHTSVYTVFYIFIIVFEGRLAHSDMIQTKVRQLLLIIDTV